MTVMLPLTRVTGDRYDQAELDPELGMEGCQI